ncbi:hypothetical protein [Kaistia granuli]|uniref:hypothetical protein n=1 Tax=Kaistia granuli TaxID=363259 RepID=UPI00035F4C5E|nr:hypothetical protein [Kaistia granuli]
MRRLLRLIAILIVVFAGYWAYYVFAAGNPSDPLGVEINKYMPTAAREFACKKLKERFADAKTAPEGCAEFAFWAPAPAPVVEPAPAAVEPPAAAPAVEAPAPAAETAPAAPVAPAPAAEAPAAPAPAAETPAAPAPAAEAPEPAAPAAEAPASDTPETAAP